jgi:hypothetical protein
MSNRLVDLLKIRDGGDIIHFFNKPDVPAMLSVSSTIDFTETSFYGLTNLSRLSELFWVIYKRNHVRLEEMIRDKDDIEHQVVYSSFRFDKNKRIDKGPQLSKLYYTGEGYLNPMEFAILLRDEKAVEILKRYNRNTAHIIRSFTSKYSDHAVTLATRYGHDDIVTTLLSNATPQ